MALPNSFQVSTSDVDLYNLIPTHVDAHGIDFHMQNRLFTYLSKPLIDDLASLFKDKHVLEAYAGRGHLSALLKGQGIDVRATSVQRGYDGASEMGQVGIVEELDVVNAVIKYREWLDVLLVCWPTADDGLYQSIKNLPPGAIIVFIGEVTDYTSKPPFLGGCATDAFFDSVDDITDQFSSVRYLTSRCDCLRIYRPKRL